MSRIILWLLGFRFKETEDRVEIHLPKWLGERRAQEIADRLWHESWRKGSL